jgi:hypothetical protein
VAVWVDDDDRRVPVRVRLPDAYRFDSHTLPQTLIRTAEGKPIPVSAVARMERANGQGELKRENLRVMASVTARLEGRDLGTVVRDIQQRLTERQLPVGYSFEIGGQYQAQQQAFRELLMVFALEHFVEHMADGQSDPDACGDRVRFGQDNVCRVCQIDGGDNRSSNACSCFHVPSRTPGLALGVDTGKARPSGRAFSGPKAVAVGGE